MKRFRILYALIALLLAGSPAFADTIYYTAQKGQGMDRWFGSYYNKTSQYDEQLRVGGWGDEYDTMLRFDLSSMPQMANRAIIWLFMHPDGAGYTAIEWCLNTRQWQSPTVGWNNQPKCVSYGTSRAPTGPGWYGVDITYFYNMWRKADQYSTPNYGFKLRPWPRLPNNRYSSSNSSNNSIGYFPTLQVDYTPPADEYKLKLRWPLPTPHPAPDTSCNPRLIWGCLSPLKCRDGSGNSKIHNGTDYTAAVNTEVYAAEDGVVREILTPEGWASSVVIEHNHIRRGKYTTVYWHVNPSVKVGDFVPKGMRIARVADLTLYGNDTHFHFGVRLGAYASPQSGAGALPPPNYPGCDSMYQPFPGGFVDPEDTSIVVFLS